MAHALLENVHGRSLRIVEPWRRSSTDDGDDGHHEYQTATSTHRGVHSHASPRDRLGFSIAIGVVCAEANSLDDTNNGSTQLTVIDNQAERRFELHADGEMSVLTYRISGDRIRLIHTEVPPDQRGRGYADMLARAALERAARDHLRVVPLCPFVRGFLERHPEYHTLVATDSPH